MFTEEIEGLERDHAQAARELDNLLYPPMNMTTAAFF